MKTRVSRTPQKVAKAHRRGRPRIASNEEESITRCKFCNVFIWRARFCVSPCHCSMDGKSHRFYFRWRVWKPNHDTAEKIWFSSMNRTENESLWCFCALWCDKHQLDGECGMEHHMERERHGSSSQQERGGRIKNSLFDFEDGSLRWKCTHNIRHTVYKVEWEGARTIDQTLGGFVGCCAILRLDLQHRAIVERDSSPSLSFSSWNCC